MWSLLTQDEDLGHSLAEARSSVIGHDVDVDREVCILTCNEQHRCRGGVKS